MSRVSHFNQPLMYLVQFVLCHLVLKEELLKYHLPLIYQPCKPVKGENEAISHDLLCKPCLALDHSCCSKKKCALKAQGFYLEAAFRFWILETKDYFLLLLVTCFTSWTSWKLECCNTKTSSTGYILKASPVLAESLFSSLLTHLFLGKPFQQHF